MAKDIFDFEDDDLGDPFFDDLSAELRTGNNEDAQRALEQFDAEVERRIKILQSRKAPVQARVDAAYWLGDSGAPKAITALLRGYKDKDPKVRQASTYALGQFKALDQAIQRDDDELVLDALGREENQFIVELLTDIAQTGRRSKRKRIPSSALAGVLVLLMVILAGLVVGNMAVANNPAEARVQIAAVNGAADSQAALDELSSRFSRLREYVTTLQADFTAVQNGQTPGCTAGWTPENYIVSAEAAQRFPDLQRLAEIYNGIQGENGALGIPQADYQLVCSSPTSFTSDNLTSTQTILTQIITTLDTANTDISTIQTAINTLPTATATVETPPTAAAPPTDAAAPVEGGEVATTSEPTVNLTPDGELSRIEFNRYLTDLLTIIDDAVSQRGYVSLLYQYWVDVENSAGAGTGGCTVLPPTIPEDYVLPAELATAAPDLNAAVEQINVALELSREGWRQFRDACADGSYTVRYEVGKITAQTAADAFENARTTVNAVAEQ